MAVEQDQFKVTPYTSTVPLVQMPPSAIEGQTRPSAPLEGQFGGHRGTPALAIGDSLLKGFMLGHQQKEEKKQAQATATINAADAASEAAYQTYQDALQKAGGKHEDPAAKAAYDAYTTAFQAGKQAKAQFVMPDKTQKGKKSEAGPDGKKKQASAGFNNIKDFFEANPHIVPQIALTTMQPKPPGLSPQGQQQVQNLESDRLANEQKQRTQQNEQTYQTGFTTFAHLSPEEIASLPPDAKKGYEGWNNARAALAPMKFSGSPQKYKLPNGKIANLYKEEADQNYPGAEPYIAGMDIKPGTPAFAQQAYAKKLGKDVKDLTWDELEAAKAEDKAGTTPTTATQSTSTTNPQGDRTTTTRKIITPGRLSAPPKAGSSSSGKTGQGISKPPQAGKAAQTGSKSGGLGPPPKGRETALTASVTRQAVTKQQQGYQKAETAHAKALSDAEKAFTAAQNKAASSGDQSLLKAAQAEKDRAITRAELDLEEAKAGVAQEYDSAVRSIGGTPGSQGTGSLPPGWQ